MKRRLREIHDTDSASALGHLADTPFAPMTFCGRAWPDVRNEERPADPDHATEDVLCRSCKRHAFYTHGYPAYEP